MPPSRRSPAASMIPASLIRRFRNDALPKIAVTVDLLTTGIDVPKIENLVFIRRVNSRILYEQMLGRATRLAPKSARRLSAFSMRSAFTTRFSRLTAMKPVVVNPN